MKTCSVAPAFRRGIARITTAALITAPLAGCGFDTFDGRWVANVPPAGNCCPSQVVMDVSGHKFTGTVEDCNGAEVIQGHVDSHGQATLHAQGHSESVKFSGVNFTTTLPNDRCRRSVVGNKGG